MKQILKLLVMVYTDDKKGHDWFDTRIEYKSSLVMFS